MLAEKRITFKNSKGQTLVGYYKKESRGILMLLCHGIRSYSDPQLFPQIKVYQELYNAMGISTLRFDATGFGESEGKDISLVQYLSDIGSALAEYSQGHNEIILNVASFSGQIGAIAAVKYNKITKLMITNGLFNFWQLGKRGRMQLLLTLLMKPRYIKELFVLKKLFHPEKISISTLVCVSEKDTVISPKQSHNFYNSLTSDKILVVIPGVDHEGENLSAVMESFKANVRPWLLKQLKLSPLKVKI